MKKVLLFGLAMAVAWSACAWAQGPRHGSGPAMSMDRGGPHGRPPREMGGPGWHDGAGLMFLIRHPVLAEKVGLTKEEMQKLRDVAFEHRKQMIGLRADLEKARLEVEVAKAADRPDQAAVEKAIDKAHAIEAQIEKAQYRYQQAVRSIISEERLRDLWESAQELREKRWEARKHRPHGKGREHMRGWRGMWKSGRAPSEMDDTPDPDDEDDETEPPSGESLLERRILKS